MERERIKTLADFDTSELTFKEFYAPLPCRVDEDTYAQICTESGMPNYSDDVFTQGTEIAEIREGVNGEEVDYYETFITFGMIHFYIGLLPCFNHIQQLVEQKGEKEFEPLADTFKDYSHIMKNLGSFI